MRLGKWVQFAMISSCVISLGACSLHKKQNQADINQANAAYADNGSAESSGIGRQTSFTEQVSGEQMLSKHTYYFDFNSNVIHEADKPAILANADYLAAHQNKQILLEGHTDPRGSREYNIGLGERRAKSIALLMRSKGVSPDQIRIVSYGAQKLAASGHNENDYRLDRRVVLVYLNR